MTEPDTTEHDVTEHDATADNGSEEELPENLPPKAWVTLLLFAGFVVATGTCMSGIFF